MVSATVAVVTEADDLTADMVIAEMNRRGVPVARFNPADLEDALTVTARFGAPSDAPAGHILTQSRSVDLARVRSVYWRRPTWPAYEHLDEPDARFAAAQARYGLGGILYALHACHYVNHPLRNHAAEHKPLQLAVAQRMGLSVPPTLISNDPDDVRAFIARHRSVVYKALRWTPYRRDGTGMTTWTEPVTAEEVDETVRVTPHLFQARVDKVADLRVLVVGERVFAVRIESDLLDWRQDYDALSYSVVTLPDQVSKVLRDYLDYFQLASGSFDLCVDADGRMHWLELNPNGQWGWLEDETGLPIAAAFADLLVEGAP